MARLAGTQSGELSTMPAAFFQMPFVDIAFVANSTQDYSPSAASEVDRSSRPLAQSHPILILDWWIPMWGLCCASANATLLEKLQHASCCAPAQHLNAQCTRRLPYSGLCFAGPTEVSSNHVVCGPQCHFMRGFSFIPQHALCRVKAAEQCIGGGSGL